MSRPPSNTRLCRELPVAPEDEVPQDSVGECNLTPSVGHDLSDTYRPYRSASFTSDQQEVFVGVDVDGESCSCEGHEVPAGAPGSLSSVSSTT